MRIIRLTITLYFIFGIGSFGSASEKIAIKTISPDVQIVNDELQILLNEKTLSYRDSTWPKEIDNIKVENTKVPQKVIAETTNWLRTMIKSKYLPEEPNNWLIALRKPKPGFFVIKKDSEGTRNVHIKEEGTNDYLVMRYSIEGQKLQIQENGSAVCLLIDVNNPNTFSPKIEQFITNAIYEFLNYPEEQKGALKFYLNSLAYNKKTIYFGTVDCNFDRKNIESFSKRTWCNHTFIWTDGKIIYFSLVETPSKLSGPRYPRATPGLSPRFDK